MEVFRFKLNDLAKDRLAERDQEHARRTVNFRKGKEEKDKKEDATEPSASPKPSESKSKKQNSKGKADKHKAEEHGIKRCSRDGCTVTSRDTKLLLCSACKQRWFCGSVCQRAAWPTHKPECKLL